MNNKIVIFILIFLSSLFISLGHCDIYSSWNSYRILIFNYGYSGLQVNFNVTYGIGDNGLNYNSKEDFSDLRFVDYNTGYLLSAYNQTTINRNYCNIWLKLGDSQQVIMYYNNPDALSYWSLNNTFNDVIGNVVLALPMDEEEGSVVYDYSGNDNDLALTDTEFTGALYDGGLLFDSSTDLALNSTPVNLPYGANDTFTLVFWVKPTDLYQNIFVDWGGSGGVAGGWRTVFRFNSKIYWHAWGTGDFQSSLDFSVGEWQMITVSFNESQYVNIYKNLTSGGSGYRFTVDIIDERFSLGYQSLQAFYSDMNSTIDNVLFFNDALSFSQISNCYDYYADSTVVEGSVCCRVWVDVMPSVSFGSESTSEASSANAIAVIAFIFAIFAIMLIMIRK